MRLLGECNVGDRKHVSLRRGAVYAITDLNHSTWSVHKVNLFEAFAEADIPNMLRPV